MKGTDPYRVDRMTAPFCNACGTRFEGNDRFCAHCGSGRYVRSIASSTDTVSTDTAPPSADELFPDYAPAPWSASGTVLMDSAGRLAIYAVSQTDAQTALWELRQWKRSLSSAEDGQQIGSIETAIRQLSELIRTASQDHL